MKKPLCQGFLFFGVTIATRVSNKCTHLLVGNQLTPEQRQQLLHWKKPFLFAKQLNDFLESKEMFFLALPAEKTEESEAQTANLSALLTSQDEASIQLALEIMRVNGVPKSLISILFIIAFVVGLRRYMTFKYLQLK